MPKDESYEMYNRVWPRVERYVIQACLSFSKAFHDITVDDLKQECSLKLWLLITHFKEKRIDIPDDEFLQIFKTSVYNVLRDIYRSYKRSVVIEDAEFEVDDPDFTDPADPNCDIFDTVLFKQYCEIINGRLDTELERQLFELILHPDEQLVSLALQDNVESTERMKDGELVMNANEVHLYGRHYAQRLSLSPATTSRLLSKLRQKVLTVVNEE